MHESSYTPHVRRHFLAPVRFTEIPVGMQEKQLNNAAKVTYFFEEN